MKKILLAAAAALAITGCTQNEEIQSQGVNNEIKVGTIVKKSNRAADLTNTSFTEFKLSSFIVAADQDYATTGLGNAYMDGITYTGGQGKWTTTDGGVYYWPADKNVQFFGWYPAEMALTKGDTGYPTLAASIGATSVAQKDIVVAATSIAKPVGGKVNLAFKHILTKINFSYKPEAEYTYAITALKITNVGGGDATYTFNNNGVDSWSVGSTTDTEYIYQVTQGLTENGGYYTLDSADGSLMLLPQTLTSGTSKIVMSYTVTGTADYSYTATDKEIAITKGLDWGIGKSVRYKLSLPAGGDKIVIDTETLPGWEPEEGAEN